MNYNQQNQPLPLFGLISKVFHVYLDNPNSWTDHPVLRTMFVNNISDIKGLFKYLSK